MSNDCSERRACALHSARFSGKFHTISCVSMRPHRQPFSHQIQHACATVQYFIDTSLKDCCYSDTRHNYFLPQSFCSETFYPLLQPGSSHSCGELFCINQPVEYWISSATGNVVLCAVCVCDWLLLQVGPQNTGKRSPQVADFVTGVERHTFIHPDPVSVLF